MPAIRIAKNVVDCYNYKQRVNCSDWINDEKGEGWQNMHAKLETLLKGETLMVGGHRGLSGRFPENTLGAVKAAIDMGVDFVEIDIYLSKDGVPVLAHDQKLERCSNGTGLVTDYTLKELRQLDFGSYKGEEFKGTVIPTLEEFYALMQQHPDVLMDIDVKNCDTNIQAARAALKMAEEMKVADRCVFNSLDGKVVDDLYEKIGRRVIIAPEEYPGMRNFVPGKDGTYSRSWGACMLFRLLSHEIADKLRDFGQVVGVTPADTPEQIELALECGVMLPICNDPELMLRKMGKYRGN